MALTVREEAVYDPALVGLIEDVAGLLFLVELTYLLSLKRM